MRKKIGELIFQMIPVTLGVYLGFAISDWAENDRSREQAEVLVQNVITEIESNQAQLNLVLEYHEMIQDSSSVYARMPVLTKRPRFFKGVRVMKLTQSAYQTGIQTGIINELSIDKIEKLNQLYTFQEDYNQYTSQMMASLISKDFSESEEDVRKIMRFLSITMTDVTFKEKDLLARYDEIKTSLLEEHSVN